MHSLEKKKLHYLQQKKKKVLLYAVLLYAVLLYAVLCAVKL
jgi:hypothetical protein